MSQNGVEDKPVDLNNAPVVTAAATELYISSVPLTFSMPVFKLQYIRAMEKQNQHYLDASASEIESKKTKNYLSVNNTSLVIGIMYVKYSFWQTLQNQKKLMNYHGYAGILGNIIWFDIPL